MESQEKHIPVHPWRARLVVGIIMLLLSFIGLIVSDLFKGGAWTYWRIMVPVYAALSIWLSWYLRKKTKKVSAIRIWHELLHWAVLVVAVYLVSMFVSMGIIGRFEAGLEVLIMLALTTFLAGVYHDMIFLIIGVLLGCFTAGAAFFTEYLYTIMLPLTIVAALLMVWLIHHHHKNIQKEKHAEDSES
ncbi:MAG: hypothetical protein P0S95_00825 [Rhabdochlamydiaceae bacterium]|nr:hypothetical protein [Candidatus Amphrikana amoebophyrae]